MNTIVPTWDKGGETTKVLVKTIIFFFPYLFPKSWTVMSLWKERETLQK